jgi:hypothetical protein
MAMDIRDWLKYLAEIYRVTAPGGHVQLSEKTVEFMSETGTLGADAALKVMERALRKHAAWSRYDVDVGSKLVGLVEEAGFHSLEEQIVQVPCGTWPSG